jgi:antitoxin component of MazEF toxin-antitoxin module
MMDGWLFMPVFESSRKVQVFGSSLAMTLPALFVKASEVEKGSVLSVMYGLDGVLVASGVDTPEALRERLVEIIEKLDEDVKMKNEKKLDVRRAFDDETR